MVIVSTSGVYISVVGPYLAKNKDATFLQHIMDVIKWDKTDDILIIDRGFGDSVTYLKELGFQAIMPAFIKKRGGGSRCLLKMQTQVDLY